MKIKNLMLCALATTLLLAACSTQESPLNVYEPSTTDAAYTPEQTSTTDKADTTEPTQTAYGTSAPTDISTLASNICEFCGDHYIGEDLRTLQVLEFGFFTYPMNIRDSFEWEMVDALEGTLDAFLSGFDTVHEVTYQQWEADWYNTIILWSDTPLRDFYIVSLAVGEDVDDKMGIFAQELIFSTEELLTSHAIVLNVAFAHYLLPHGGLIFTDENGDMRRMFINESMRGGCYPHFTLSFYDEDGWDWLHWD